MFRIQQKHNKWSFFLLSQMAVSFRLQCFIAQLHRGEGGTVERDENPLLYRTGWKWSSSCSILLHKLGWYRQTSTHPSEHFKSSLDFLQYLTLCKCSVDCCYSAHSKSNGKERNLRKLDVVVSLSVSHPLVWSPWTYGADFVLSIQVIECVHVVFHDSLLDPYSSQFLQRRGSL